MTTRPPAAVRIWLLTGAVLIALMVTIGGITRLTGSGLSITEWNVLMGALPPLSAADWQELFARYQSTPQYQQVNTHFTLAEFKSIFWWEYLHRLIGRGLGLVFLVPFAVFLARGWFDARLRKRVLLIFALGAFQGVLGWFMVASGLVDRPSVSHYRLAAHLLTALLTFAVTLWVAFDLRQEGHDVRRAAASPRLAFVVRAFVALLAVQITWGALVAGLRAGGLFNTFPLMEGSVVPAGLGVLSPAWRNLTENPVGVQFVHRMLAWALLGLGLWLARALARAGFGRHAWLLGVALAVQFTLGALTILRFPVSPVLWGTLHQAGGVGLLAAAVAAMHATRPLHLPDTVETPVPARA